jgi:hypothetical protein
MLLCPVKDDARRHHGFTLGGGSPGLANVEEVVVGDGALEGVVEERFGHATSCGASENVGGSVQPSAVAFA